MENLFEEYCERNLAEGDYIDGVSKPSSHGDTYACTLRIITVKEGTVMRLMTGPLEYLQKFREGFFNSKK